MNLLLDTCAFLWLAGQPAKLSKAATEAINDPANLLHLSDVSVWEIALKYRSGKLPLPETPRIWISKQADFFQFQKVPIDIKSLLRSGELPAIHEDPFDRLLAAQALAEPFYLVTPDRPFREYGVACLW